MKIKKSIDKKFQFVLFLRTFKGGSHPNHFIAEINDGKSRIRHRTALNLNNPILNRF